MDFILKADALMAAVAEGLVGRMAAAGETVLLKALNCLQGARYIELAEVRPQNESFVYGSLRERVAI